MKANVTEPYAIKLCHDCGGEMGLYEIPGPDIYPDLEWGCHDCGINELYSEWQARTGRKVYFYEDVS
jgi:hypothetical protein